MNENTPLSALVETTLSRPAPDAIIALAKKARAIHGSEVLAILAYGSCLRGIDPRETLADLYILTKTTAGVSSNPISRLGCSLLPPNVYYLEAEINGITYRAKYAALPLDLFEEWVQPTTKNPYFWARFSQPSALIWVLSAPVRTRVIAAITQAVQTMIFEARLLMADNATSASPLAAWNAVLRETYQTELRSESADRGNSIVAAEESWYRQTYEATPASPPLLAPPSIATRWARQRRWGKLLAALRLLKAAFTFKGGADYLAWKIERHSKVKVELTPWQRRHPILAAIVLVPRLYRKGGFR